MEHKKEIQSVEESNAAADLSVRQFRGLLESDGFRYAIVVSRFNESLTSELLSNAVSCLREHGALDEEIEVVWVPGAYEIPSVVQQLAAKGRFDAVIALGVVIQGETQHAECINHSIAHALLDISRETSTPVIHEVVSAYSIAQAEARCCCGRKSRGWYAAEAAIEMVHVFRAVKRV